MPQDYLSTDPNAGQPVGDYLSSDPMAGVSSGRPQASARNAAIDFGIGLIKSPLATISAGGNMLRRIAPIRAIDEAVGSIKLGDMAPEAQGDAQWYGKRAGDVLTALPTALAAKGVSLVPRVATEIERRAVPGLGDMAGKVLEMGRGIVTRGNANALQAAAKATPKESSIQVQRFGKWVPRSTGPSPLQPAADAMSSAANAPMRGPSWTELGALAGTGGLLRSWPVTAAVATGQVLARPLPGSIIAQGLHSGAPLIQGAAGAGSNLAAQAAMRALFGQDPMTPVASHSVGP